MTQRCTTSDFGFVTLCQWVWRYARGHSWTLAGVLTVMILRVGVEVLRPWPMKVLVDNVLEGRRLPGWLDGILPSLPSASTPRQLIPWCVAATLVVFFMSWTLRAIGQMSAINLGQSMSYDLAGDVFRHLQRLSLRLHGTRSVGDSLRRVMKDSACISIIVKDAMIPVLSSLLSLVVMFVILWRLNWVMTLAAVAVVPLMMLTLRLYARPMSDASYVQQEADSRIYQVVERNLTAIPVVQAFCREEQVERDFAAATDASLAATLTANRLHFQFKVLIGLVTALGTAAIFWLGAQQVLAGKVTVGGLLVFLSYLASLYTPLEVLANTSSTVQGATGSARRVNELLSTGQEVAEAPHARALAQVRGEVRIENATLGYEPGTPVLHDISLTARAGETIAIVGPTGAGKSTLVSLIPRFLDPWQGCVKLDGQDLRDLRIADLRQRVALVLQEPFLFPATIAQNIGYGRPGATADQIIAAARAANAHDFIAALPQGYDTVIGQRGATLSGGERQRLSIARALLKDAPVLILDEPTSALDVRTEQLLLEALQRLKQNRTTFIIAHRLSTVRDADRIVALDGGRIVEIGPHADLLARGGLYARLHRRQFAQTANTEGVTA